MPQEKRKFNGLDFKLFMTSTKKTDVDKFIKFERDHGYNARVIVGKHKGRRAYHIYTRPSDKRMKGMVNRFEQGLKKSHAKKKKSKR